MATSALEQRSQDVIAESEAARARGRLLDPWAVAVLAAFISGAWVCRPSLWFDEGATISAAASRTLPELWKLLGHIDAVHGLYYLVMHGWFAIFPPTEFWSRIPSALAIGVAAAGVVVFTRQFTPGRGTAICAGVVFAILPRTTWAGIEARSYAFSVAAAIWLTVLLVTAVRRNRPRLWVGYAAGLMVSILLSLNLVLLVLVYAVMLTQLTPKGSRKSPVIWWAASTAVALGVMTPFILFAHGQAFQVNWLFPVSWHYAFDITQRQYFDHSVPFAVLSGVIMVAAVVARRFGAPAPAGDMRGLLTICIGWIVLPTTAVVVYSAFGEPMYFPRYLILTTPAMAVLLAVCVITVARRPWPIVGVVLLFAVAAVPDYLFVQRWPYAKEGWDYSQVADVISSHAAPGDCLLADNTVPWRPGPIRALLATRPAAFRSLIDVERGVYGPKVGSLWDGHVAVWLTTAKINRCTTLWTITNYDKSFPEHQVGQALSPGAFGRTPAYRFPGYLGFHIVERWQFHYSQVIKSTR
ncbi:glycosyltransferase family 39 protein [Mycobacterium stomatepiae]|uniref:Membrane protein n=1 Tax=Mycobacterium stomatepiae TaxID=470076 RepID=A0A7I7Q4C4_9MYCO|nr:glycosyltransferase family 39 protein [Mycobacterium stomatepiae]MCV7168007.1 glycosyltransferase family 39 protein [Mycobacterium stomatepiae]BBY20856.1 membrane protein [Mycobacterium stomatepiae]